MIIIELLLYIVLAYCYGSLSEWVAHRFAIHNKIKGLESVFEGHSAHHKTYPRNHFHDPRDENTCHNLVLCPEHVVLFMLPLAVFMLFFSPLFSLVLTVFGVVHFYFYNRVHAAMHLGHDLSWVPKWFLKACIFNHVRHHQHPNKYFCVTLPGADYVLGTTCKLSKKDLQTEQNELDFARLDKSHLITDWDFGEIAKLDNCVINFKYFNNGYVGPAPKGLYKNIGKGIVEVVRKLFVGSPLEIEGSFPKDNGPYVYALSHNSWADLFIIQSVAPDLRLMAARSVMQFLGLGLILGPFLGCWAAEGDGKGTAVQAGIDALKRGESVGICPEGWAYFDQFTRPFKSGVCRIAKGGNAKIVPVYIDYYSYRSDKFKKLWFPLQVVLDALDYTKPRVYKVIVGEPLAPDTDIAMVEYKVKQLGGYYGY